MTDIGNLIEQLASRAAPVRRIASPARRTATWAGLAVVLIALLAAALGLRSGLAQSFAHGPTLVEWAASVLTGFLAVYAVFQISVPGRSPSWAWLPLPPLLLWLSGLGWGCAREYAAAGPEAFLFELASADCAMAITFTSVPLGLVLLLMVRHAGVVRPAPTAMLAALGSAAFSSAGVSLYHSSESALMVLVWHVGAVALLSLACLLVGRPLFSWIGHVRR